MEATTKFGDGDGSDDNLFFPFSLSSLRLSFARPLFTCFISASILSRNLATEASLGLVRLDVPVPPPMPPVDADRAASDAAPLVPGGGSGSPSSSALVADSCRAADFSSSSRISKKVRWTSAGSSAVASTKDRR